MKSSILLVIVAFFVILCNAQSTPEAFLGMLPPVPSVDCNRKSSLQTEAMIVFQDQISSFKDAISEALKEEKQKNKNQKISGNFKNQAMAQSGLSENELNKLSDKNTSKSENDRLKDKAVKNQTGFSMNDMDKVKKMSKEDRMKWAMQNYNKVMQNEKSKSEETKPFQGQNVSIADLATEQQQLAENLQHHYSRLNKIKTDLETLAAEQKVVLDAKLKEINVTYRDVNDGEASTEGDMAKLKEKNNLIRKAKVEYCSKLTPQQIDYIITYENVLKENILPDLKRTEEIEHQIRQLTISQSEESCFARLRAIEDYSSALSKAFVYYLSVDKDE